MNILKLILNFVQTANNLFFYNFLTCLIVGFNETLMLIKLTSDLLVFHIC